MRAKYAIRWSWGSHLEASSEEEAKEIAFEQLLSDLKHTESIKNHFDVQKMWNIRSLEEQAT